MDEEIEPAVLEAIEFVDEELNKMDAKARLKKSQSFYYFIKTCQKCGKRIYVLSNCIHFKTKGGLKHGIKT